MAVDLDVTVHGIGIRTGATYAGRFAAVNVVDEGYTDIVIYTVPALTGLDYVIGSISICNKASITASNVNLAVALSGTPDTYEFIEWNASIVPNGVLERTQLILNPGDNIVMRVGTP